MSKPDLAAARVLAKEIREDYIPSSRPARLAAMVETLGATYAMTPDLAAARAYAEALLETKAAPEPYQDIIHDSAKEILALTARVEELERIPGYETCPDCDGSGWLGRAKDGRKIACEVCGGHEDRLGTGRIRIVE